MEKIKVVNIKCQGCINSIKKSLEKIGCKNIDINLEKQEIIFDGNKKEAIKKLNQLGYPQANSKEAMSLTKKAKSYLSCAIGKIKK